MHGDVDLGDFLRFIFGLAVSISTCSSIHIKVQFEDEKLGTHGNNKKVAVRLAETVAQAIRPPQPEIISLQIV